MVRDKIFSPGKGGEANARCSRRGWIQLSLSRPFVQSLLPPSLLPDTELCRNPELLVRESSSKNKRPPATATSTSRPVHEFCTFGSRRGGNQKNEQTGGGDLPIWYESLLLVSNETLFQLTEPDISESDRMVVVLEHQWNFIGMGFVWRPRFVSSWPG